MSRYTLWCLTCGSTRTVDSEQPLAGPGPTTCFKCGDVGFSSEKRLAPRITPAWLVTEKDRRLLKSLRIGSGAARDSATDRSQAC